ncbi:MAG TPA: filamentous hemagglutinin N-terminal domain-containing protein [Phenylobacterium sp.]|uniref:beta strand repeat-containing protein n=1 Tax=Phenylobacterium sp. TaxID=1871053 RepID=UPI002D6B2480|nr:filamentous hemagglutinin N-terminal domain-containing protein [Phenylobacterium sp.]HZZ67064.1 filamentous hemagglutinin N-terminal domain-containing protein [Phenylobacterium sp.]
MTSPAARHAAGRHPRGIRRALLCRTALCGVVLGFAAAAPPALALPVLAATPPQVNAGGGLPVIVNSASTTSVTLNGARTVIDWSTYNVAAGEAVNYSFGARNWIVLNRIQDSNPSTIAGAISGTVNGVFGGNIWFASHSGMIFGAGAQVDAGGLLISTAAPDLATFLDPANLTFNFPGTEVVEQPSIGMETGSSINGHGGLVAIVAPIIVTQAGTSVTGQNGSNVLYGGATGFTLRLAQNAPGDFDLVDFVIPAGAGSDGAIMMDLQNATTANSVFVAAVSRSQASASVINLEGLITAQAATADGGDIILTGDAGITGKALGAPAAGVTPTDIYLRTASASRDILLQTNGDVFSQAFVRPPPPGPITPPVILPPDDGGFGNGSTGDGPPPPSPPPPSCDCGPSFQLSNLAAGRDISLIASEEILLGAAHSTRDLTADGSVLQANTLTVGRNLALTATGGDLTAGALSLTGAGAVTSSGAAELDNLSLAGGATLNVQAASNIVLGDGTGAAAGGTINLQAGGNVTVDLASGTLNTVTAGGLADVQANSLNVATIAGGQVLVRGGSVTVGQATSAGDVYVSSTGGSATVGTATAGDDVYVLASGGTASLTSATLNGAGADTLGASFAGNPDSAGNGRVVQVLSTDGDAQLGQGSGSVGGATSVSVQAGQDAIVQLATAPTGTLSVVAARDATLSAPSVTLSAVQAGRDISLIATGGDFTSTAPLVATRNLTIGATGALTLGDITAASGSITLTGATVTAGALDAAQDLTLKATGGGVSIASFRAGEDLTVQGATLSLGQELAPIGRDLTIITPGDFTTGALTAARNLTLDIGGVANVTGASVPGAIDIVARDINLTGALSGANVQIESAAGPLQVGGTTAPASGMWLDNTEFGLIHASGQVNLLAGPAAGTARGDLTLLDLSFNPQATPQVNFLVGSGQNALVEGVVAPTASGGTLHIGDSANAAWQPASILVSGQIGVSTFSDGGYGNVRAFDDVRLFANQDIIIGSPRFIGLVQATSLSGIDVGKGLPAGVAPVGAETDRVLISTGDLELSAAGKVVSQNTAPSPLQSVGIFLTGKSAATQLIIDPPQLLDIYGSFSSPSGAVVSGFTAGSTVAFSVVDAAGNPTTPPAGAAYRFDSCTIGTTQCSAAVSASDPSLAQNIPTMNTPGIYGDTLSSDAGGTASSGGPGANGSGDAASADAGSGDEAAEKAAARDRNSGPSLLSVAPVDADQALTDPVVTGAGSEELWRRHDQGKAGDKAKDRVPGAKP